MWVTALFLTVPLGHQVMGHSIHLRALRLLRPGMAVPRTRHENNHQSRSRAVRVSANLGWLAYLAIAVWAGLAIAG